MRGGKRCVATRRVALPCVGSSARVRIAVVRTYRSGPGISLGNRCRRFARPPFARERHGTREGDSHFSRIPRNSREVARRPWRVRAPGNTRAIRIDAEIRTDAEIPGAAVSSVGVTTGVKKEKKKKGRNHEKRYRRRYRYCCHCCHCCHWWCSQPRRAGPTKNRGRR